MCRTEKNVCFTGVAGSGKTYVTQRVVRWLLDQGYVVICVAPLARVLTDLASLPYHKGLRVDTLHRFVATNTFQSVLPGAEFKRRLEQGATLLTPTNTTGLGVLVIGECFFASQCQLDLVWNCAAACNSFKLVRAILEGDPTQLEPPQGFPAVMSKLFGRRNMQLITLTETMRFDKCPRLKALVNDLRDTRRGVSPQTKELLYNHALVNSKRGDVTLAYTHAAVHQARVRHFNAATRLDATNGLKIFPVATKATDKKNKCRARKSQKPATSLIVFNDAVFFTHNQTINKQDSNDPRTKFRIPNYVPNGTAGTVVDWHNRGMPGTEEVDADDPKVAWVEIQLETGHTVKITPIVVDGWQFYGLTSGAAATIHAMQGRTFKTGTVSIDVTSNKVNDDPRDRLYVAMSRVIGLNMIKSLKINDIDILGKRPHVHPKHQALRAAVLEAEETETARTNHVDHPG